MDPATLATSLVTTVLLPYAKMGAEKLMVQLTEDAGSEAATGATALAQRIWNRVMSVFQSGAEQGTLEQFQRRPELIQPVVESMLEEKLTSDPVLKQDLERMIGEKLDNGSSAQTLIQGAYIAGVVNAQGAHISGNARVAGVQIGGNSIPTPAAPSAE